MLKKTSQIIILCICVVTLGNLFSCQTSCNHVYALNKVIDATCTTEGYTEYICSECGDTYRETIPMLAHTPGSAPTFDAAQSCTICGTILQEKLQYTPYSGDELAINHYFGYADGFVETTVDSRYHDAYTQDTLQYRDQNGNLHPLEINLPLQEFYSHKILSVSSLTTEDEKNYVTDSGFMAEFSFNPAVKNITELYAWSKGDKCLQDEFSHLSEEDALNAVKVVAAYPVSANSSHYNRIYEVIDFSSSYIEVAKKVGNEYVSVKKIETVEDWTAFLQTGNLSDDNGRLFFGEGTYRILFKYDVIWVTNPSSPLYDENGKSFYPYGRINSQYDSFYVTVTDENMGILLPSNIKDQDKYFCQVKVATKNATEPFVSEYSNLIFGNSVIFNINAKVGKSEKGYYYDQKQLNRFDFIVSVYNEYTDTYDEYKTFDLTEHLSDSTVTGEEISINIGKDESIRGKKCKMSIVYTIDGVSKQQDYYYTLLW